MSSVFIVPVCLNHFHLAASFIYVHVMWAKGDTIMVFQYVEILEIFRFFSALLTEQTGNNVTQHCLVLKSGPLRFDLLVRKYIRKETIIESLCLSVFVHPSFIIAFKIKKMNDDVFSKSSPSHVQNIYKSQLHSGPGRLLTPPALLAVFMARRAGRHLASRLC